MTERDNSPPLSGDTIVYRAVASNSWFDKDSGELLPIAFKLRPADAGISVNYNCSVEQARTSRRACFGVAQLVVGAIRSLDERLDVIPDEPTHAEITGPPHPEEDDDLASYFADLLVNIATIVSREKYVAPKI